MRKALFLAGLLFIVIRISAQDNNVQQLINDGITLNDKGDYEGALKKYDEALAIDKNNYSALYEKSYTLYNMQRYDDCIDVCKFLLKLEPGKSGNSDVYVNYGSALDDKGKPKDAIKIYNKGIKAYPDYYLLRYNKGLTLVKMGKEKEGIESLEKDLQLNPLHASAHNVLAILTQPTNKIAALLPTLVFLAIEPQGNRAKLNVQRMESILNANVEKKDEKNITISLSPDVLKKNNKKKEDDFQLLEMTMSFTSALDYDDKYKNETPVERLHRKLDVVVSSLKESGENARGFFRKFYAPFFKELADKDFEDTYCHLAYSSYGDATNTQWLKDNAAKTEAFYAWLKKFQWPE